jgi:nitrite reductase/ring-hydroxylating ferredoxin subunit
MSANPVFEWVAAGSPPPAEGAMLHVDLRGREILVCRVEDRLYAIEDRCPHANVRLSGGCLTGFVVECPIHGGRLDVRDGSPVEPPIRRASDKFAVRLGLRGDLEVLLPQE